MEVFEKKINEVIGCIEKNVNCLDNFLSVRRDLSNDQLTCCKSLYDVCRALDGDDNRHEDYLPTLFLDDFNAEQVWQQIELVNKTWPSRLKHFVKNFKKSVKFQSDEKDAKVFKEDDETVENNSDDKDDDEEKEEDEDDDERDGDDNSVLGENDDDGGAVKEEEEEDEEDDDDDDEGCAIKYDDFYDAPPKPSAIDDFANMDDDGDDLDKASDDFGERGDDEEDVDMEEDDDDDDEEEEEDRLANDVNRELIRDESDNKQMVKSSFERRQEMLSKKINELEEKTTLEKDWQLKGEIGASKRPLNSLLQEVLDFDTATKPAMVITEEVNKTIEEKILQRLKDNIWDGPKRKIKTKERTFELKKAVAVLSDEKSEMSLEKIYEQEYLDTIQKKEEKVPLEIEEIKQSMAALFRKLDALCNFHFTPKPSMPEVEIVANNAAITMEEVAPTAVSEAMLLAPEEIADKSKKLIGSTERTKTNKKSDLRARKKRQHHIRLEKEEKQRIKKIKLEKKESLHKSLTDVHLKEKEKTKKGKNKKSSKSKLKLQKS
ncbi:hypothetical protein HELRODRAFT_102915 [Helobdella robusta]|uniref:U3 small nucleolar ribonucleoprotein protein MPP10 n=1 Tax=Helobdella robusta TaxID=6412 RepID=T1EDD0_HELRO|nr:hypothetical protein HELRODRAFT_102915 [Helobdella robusta]ESN94922.1 hypothetical protein HELRODRAFT_102915 [Helobdella robusta]